MGRRKKAGHTDPSGSRLRRQHTQAVRELEAALRDRRALRHQLRAARLLQLPTYHSRRSMLPNRMYPRDMRGELRDPHRRHLFRFRRAVNANTTESGSALLLRGSYIRTVTTVTCTITCLATALSAFVYGLTSAIGVLAAAASTFLLTQVTNDLYSAEDSKIIKSNTIDASDTQKEKCLGDTDHQPDLFADGMQQSNDRIRQARAALLAAKCNSRQPQKLDAEAHRLLALLPGASPASDEFQSIVFDKDGVPIAIPVDNSPVTVMAASKVPEDQSDVLHRPVRVTKDTVARDGSRIRKGEVGFVSQQRPDAWAAGYIQVTFPELSNQNQIAWVLDKDLEINMKKQWGKMSMEAHIHQPNRSIMKTTPLDDNDFPVTKLAFHICSSIMLAPHTDRILPEALYQTLASAESIVTMARKLGTAVHKAGLTKAFDPKNKASIHDFKNNAQNINAKAEKDDENGIYMGIYSNFKKGEQLEGQKPRVYVGKTGAGFGNRCSQHEKATKAVEQGGKGLVHYHIAAQAKEREYIILAIADDQWTEDDSTFAEQILMLILRTYRPEALDLMKIADGTTTNVDVDEKETEETLAVTLTDRFVASELSAIAKSVLDRLGFHDFLGTSGGCNWQSPFYSETEDREPVLWIKVDYGDRSCYFRRPVKIGYQASHSSKYRQYLTLYGYNRKSSGGKDFKHTIKFEESATNQGPEEGTMTYMSFEIMKVGRHPQALARLPDIGGMTNWDEANQVALRAQWQDKSGTWWTKYLQHPGDNGIKDKNYPGSHPWWVHATAIRNKLERKVWKQDHKDDPKIPPYWHDLYRTMILQVSYDSFEQKFTVTQLARQTTPIPFPTIDYPEVRRKMEAGGLALERFDHARPDDDQMKQWDLSTRGGKVKRKHCDTVAASDRRLKVSAATVIGRSRAGGGSTGQCEFCALFGRRCTFTREDKLFADQDKVQRVMCALIPPEYAMLSKEHGRLQKIPDPGFQNRQLKELDGAV